MRSQAIKLYVMARAKGVSEGCDEPAPFESKIGPYLECHHLYRIADRGPDVIDRTHYSRDAISFNEKLMRIAVQKEIGF